MLAQREGVCVIAFATPAGQRPTFSRLRCAVEEGAAVAVLGFEANDPTGYGPLIEEDGRLAAIVEHKDATEAERQVRRCNAG